MASNNEHQVINMEPKPQENPSSKQKKFDENGDEILQEGVCDRSGLRKQICFMFITAPAIASGLAFLLFMIILYVSPALFLRASMQLRPGDYTSLVEVSTLRVLVAAGLFRKNSSLYLI